MRTLCLRVCEGRPHCTCSHDCIRVCVRREVGIDDALVRQRFDTEEEIFEMNNGCLCCTVRGDLIRILHRILKRAKKLDGIIIETTGLADPAPVVQTFYMDDTVAKRARLDCILTVADCKHLELHLDEKKEGGAVNEAAQQVAFADRILLNKVDLVTKEDQARVTARIKAMNSMAQVIPCTKCEVDLSHVLGLDAFSLQRILEKDPAFLSEGDAEPPAKKAKVEGAGDGGHKHEGEEAGGHGHSHGHSHGEAEGHSHGDGHSHGHAHHHDDKVGSLAVVVPGSLDEGKFNDWLGVLLKEKGADIYRCKGVLSMAGREEKMVCQGVHMIFLVEPLGPWGPAEKRQSKMVFIGKELDKDELNKGLAACAAKEGAGAAAAKAGKSS